MSRAVFDFDNSYASLPARFFSQLAPEPVAAPQLIRLNEALAETLGLDAAALASPEGVAVLAGNAVPEGAASIATVYAGHQFGHFVPQLGDGRAWLLGEVVGRDGVRYDVQLKGSGRTPYSRGGDGRAPLGPVLREYVVSEAMASLGVPTTRSLAAVASGEHVLRQQRLPGAVLTRVAQSHIRVGTFEYFAARGDTEGLERLLAHVIERHYPEARDADDPALALLERVVARQAELVARWQLLGFIHGVMNTDNMLVSGETIDFGPCAFMDGFDAAQVYSSIDHAGRYAYRNQPAIAAWNLASLASALLPLSKADSEESAVQAARERIERFEARFIAAYRDGLRRKLGLLETRDDDDALCDALLEAMQRSSADFTLTFRWLTDLAAPSADRPLAGVYELPAALTPWIDRWRARLADEPADSETRHAAMRAVNPAIIPRNHLVEQLIAAAIDEGDFGPFHRLVDALAEPYADVARAAELLAPPRPGEIVQQTFCGT